MVEFPPLNCTGNRGYSIIRKFGIPISVRFFVNKIFEFQLKCFFLPVNKVLFVNHEWKEERDMSAKKYPQITALCFTQHPMVLGRVFWSPRGKLGGGGCATLQLFPESQPSLAPGSLLGVFDSHKQTKVRYEAVVSQPSLVQASFLVSEAGTPGWFVKNDPGTRFLRTISVLSA